METEYTGTRCPKCDSENISGGFVEIDFKSATQKCNCYDCDAAWIDRYKLIGYIDESD